MAASVTGPYGAPTVPFSNVKRVIVGAGGGAPLIVYAALATPLSPNPDFVASALIVSVTVTLTGVE